MKLKCQSCGYERDFTDAEEAFNEGWDAPPRFSYVGCDLCRHDLGVVPNTPDD